MEDITNPEPVVLSLDMNVHGLTVKVLTSYARRTVSTHFKQEGKRQALLGEPCVSGIMRDSIKYRYLFGCRKGLPENYVLAITIETVSETLKTTSGGMSS